MSVTLVPGYEGLNLKITGNVSLDNNGGFIQVRIFLNPSEKPWNAAGYKGIQLKLRGKSNSSYIFLRTNRTVFPWSYFGQKLPVSKEWSIVNLPFDEFTSENMIKSRLNTKN